MKDRPRIIFFGNPDFAAGTMRLLNDNFNIVGVVTFPDKPVGRKQEISKTAVAVQAAELNLKIFKTNAPVAKELSDLKPDLGILFAYGKIITPEILNIFPLGILNIHPSLLPKYRGATPVQTAILNNDKKTGVTIIKLDEKMDHGPIVAQEDVEINKDESAGQLQARLAKIGTNLLIKILPSYFTGEINLKIQNENESTYTKIIKREHGQINWQKSALQIYCQFKAFNPWPGVFTLWQGKRLKIANMSVLEGFFGQDLAPGTVFSNSGGLAVKCGKNAIILKELQMEGKKVLPGPEFLKGYKNFLNSRL